MTRFPVSPCLCVCFRKMHDGFETRRHEGTKTRTKKPGIILRPFLFFFALREIKASFHTKAQRQIQKGQRMV